MVFRHKGTPYALGSAIWEKYKIGESFQILDPETKAPAVKNPWFQPKPGVLANNDAALDRLVARGTVVGVCSVSLRGRAQRLAANAGVTAEEAIKAGIAASKHTLDRLSDSFVEFIKSIDHNSQSRNVRL